MQEVDLRFFNNVMVKSMCFKNSDFNQNQNPRLKSIYFLHEYWEPSQDFWGGFDIYKLNKTEICKFKKQLILDKLDDKR